MFRLMTGAADGNVGLWDASTGESLRFIACGSPVTCVATSSSGKLVCYGLQDGNWKAFRYRGKLTLKKKI